MPHVVGAEHVARIGGKPYIVCEYIDGWTLRDEILNQTLDLIRSLDIAIQFCDGIDFVHNVDLGNGTKGIVHMDIKPSHIWITRNGQVKITDFGLAHPLGSPSLMRVAGTPTYMSPEQFRTMDVDTRSDIYSFGVVLYEMLTGQPPFYPTLQDPAESWRFYERHHQEVPPKPPRQLNNLVPVALEQAVLKCLEKNPDDRYQSFKELREELIRIRDKMTNKPDTIYSKIVVEKGEVYFLDKETGKMERGRKYVLEKSRDQTDPVTIGREAPDTIGRKDILIPKKYSYVGRRQCEIYYDEGENAYFLVDYSLNGTLVNGYKVGGNRVREIRRLEHEDLIEIPAVGEKIKMRFLMYKRKFAYPVY